MAVAAVTCGDRLVNKSHSACSVTVEVEAVAVNVFHCELAQPPRFHFKRFNNPRAQRAQLFVCGVDVWGEHPVNGGLKGLASSAKENREFVARHSTDLFSRYKPTDLKTERIAVILLGSFHILNWQLRSRITERRSRFLLVHETLLRASIRSKRAYVQWLSASTAAEMIPEAARRA